MRTFFRIVVLLGVCASGPLGGETAQSPSSDGAPVRGAADAPVTIVEFSDLQCPFCARSIPVMQWVMTAYDRRVKWVFKHFPVSSSHPNAMLAHQAAVAVGEQGKFW